MPRKYLKSYQTHATKSGGAGDPLQYLFNRLKAAKIAGDHRKAEQLAMFLLPYGHGKVQNVDNDGDTVHDQLVIKLGS